MVKYAYQEFDEHKAKHQKFVKKLGDLKKDFVQGKTTLSLELLNFLKEWLLNQKYVPHVKEMSGN